MSICSVCGSSFYESGERPHMKCEYCRENPVLAKGVKKIIEDINYVQKKYNMDFNQALNIVKLHYINDNLDTIGYDIRHINEL